MDSKEQATSASDKSKSTHTAKRYSPDTGRTYPATMTSAPSTEASSDPSTYSPAGTHANPSATRASEPENMTPDTSGPKPSASFATYDHDTRSWRTSQGTFPWGSDEFSATWPRAGMTRNGTAYQLAPSAPLTRETASGLLPTPTTQDAHNNGGPSQMRRNSLPLNAFVRRWPTPTGQMARPDFQRIHRERSGADDLATTVMRAQGMTAANGGHLNPTWVEWLMGFPTGWTDLEPSETP